MTRRLTEALDRLGNQESRDLYDDSLRDLQDDLVEEEVSWHPAQPAFVTEAPVRLSANRRKILLNTALIAGAVSAAALTVDVWCGLSQVETIFRPVILLLGIAGVGVIAFGPRLRWWVYLISAASASLWPLSAAGVWPGLVDSGIPSWVLLVLTVGSIAAVVFRVTRKLAWSELTATR